MAVAQPGDSNHDLLRRKLAGGYRAGMSERDMWFSLVGADALPGDSARDLIQRLTVDGEPRDSVNDLLRQLVGSSAQPGDSDNDLLRKWVNLGGEGEVPDPPTVSDITPSSGSESGGTAVTITGTNFTGATSVTIGGVAATSVVVVNDSTITAVTPAHAAEATSVIVTTPGGSNEPNTLYTFQIADPFFDNVIALVKSEGTLTEVTGLCTVEIVGAGAISADQSKFGTTSFLTPGTGVPTDAFLKLIGPAGLFEFPGSFTWEMWVYPRALNEDSFTSLFGGQTNFGAAGSWTLQASTSGAMTFVVVNTGGPSAPAASIKTGAVGGW
jgi:hypothetical protein